MKYCPNCGKEIKENEKFCSGCGKELKEQNNIKQTRKVYEKNIVTSLLLTIFTCGIYGIYWFICLTDDTNYASGNDNETSGGMAFLLTLLTCGLYSIYWCYKMGKILERAGEVNGVSIDDNGILYIVLQIFSFGIINYCIMQSELNKIANEQK